jgi:sugar lactone lactonase YvrE
VAAGAASGSTVAVSDGSLVWTWRGDLRRRVGSPLQGVRALAWEGSSLWALADGGLYSSGGAALPWRRAYEGLAGVSAIAGGEERLWLVLGGGLVVEHARERCGSPWQSAAGGGALAQPRGIVLSPDGWFAVADTGHHRVLWYTAAGTCLASFGVRGSAPGAFQEPTGLALAEDGTLAVADTWNGRVQLLEADGSVRVVGRELYGPRGLLWLRDGSLLVADTGNRVLLRFAPPRWEREELIRFPGPVVGLAALGDLVAAALPTEGQVAIVDPGRGVELRRLAVPGWQGGEQQEGYLAVLPTGELLASAPKPGELWRLDPSGAQEPQRLPATLLGVTGLAVLPDGDLLASQPPEHRLVRVALR